MFVTIDSEYKIIIATVHVCCIHIVLYVYRQNTAPVVDNKVNFKTAIMQYKEKTHITVHYKDIDSASIS